MFRGSLEKQPIIISKTGFKIKDNYLPLLPLKPIHLYSVFIIMLAAVYLLIRFTETLPVPLMLKDEVDYPERFIAERAAIYLKNLTDIGPRVCGSYENEVLTVNTLVKIINDIKQNSNHHNTIQLDIKKWSGSFPLAFLDSMTNTYKNVQAVIVKVSSDVKTKTALLINCHYDTVPDSPGASDDGAGCAVMLEILKKVSKRHNLLKHNLIFLFNGAEENILQASHGFITQHKWATEVKAFLNLEACGAGGREILFQAGPYSPWMVETYSEVVPHPYGSSLAQEIFESGMIPGDTDFRIFRDFGNVSGLDFAWSENGYVYHTKHDTMDKIPLGSLQRIGDNILSLATALVESDHLYEENPKQLQPVFFDVLGMFVMRVQPSSALVIGLLAPVLVLLHIYLASREAKKTAAISFYQYLKDILKATLHIICSLIVGLLCNLMASILVTLLDSTFSWYSMNGIIIPLYLTTYYAGTAVCLLVLNRDKMQNPLIRGWLIVEQYVCAVNLLWTYLLLLCLYYGVRSGFIPWLWIVPTTIFSFARLYFADRSYKRIVWYMTGYSIPFLLSSYYLIGFIKMYIPVMGRSGGDSNTECMTGLVLPFLMMLVAGCTIPLLFATEKRWHLIIFLKVISAVTLLYIIFYHKPYGGPATPQRFLMIYTDRTLHYVNKRDSRVWIVDMDMNTPHTLDNYVKAMRNAWLMPIEDCEDYVYCAAPYYLPVIGFMSHTHWLNFTAPHPHLPRTTLIVKHQVFNETYVRYYFEVTGPNHMGMMISPVEGSKFVSLNITPGLAPLEGVSWREGRSTYFIYMADAHARTTPWYFHMDLVYTDKFYTNYSMDVAVAGHYLFGEHKASRRFESFAKSFPDWTAVSYWSSTLDIYRFP